jgi:hypothetical protein
MDQESRTVRPITISSRPRPAASRAKRDQFEHYRQTCSACLRNGDKTCWLCAGRGYVTGNGGAQLGNGQSRGSGGARRGRIPHGGHDVATVALGATAVDGLTETRGVLSSSLDADFAYEDWQDAGLHVIHGATGRTVGRPRHDETDLSPAAQRKRKSRPFVGRSEPDPPECNLPDECGGPCALPARHYHVWNWPDRKHDLMFGASWVKAWEGVTNSPNTGRGIPDFSSAELVAVGPFQTLARDKCFSAIYAGYQAEIPREVHQSRKGETGYAPLSVAFARIVDAESSWITEPMHAAINRLEPMGRRTAAGRLNHEWLVQTLKWRGQPCICGHVDVIEHLAAVAPRGGDGAGASPEYVADVVAAGARRAYDLIGIRSALVAS